MKQYTIVYGEWYNLGSQRNSITKMKYIECKPEDLSTTLEQEVGIGNIWFLFDGHCKQSID